MVFNDDRQSIFRTVNKNSIVEGSAIKSFGAHFLSDGSNILNYKANQLAYNKNMEWIYSDTNNYLRTRRGSTLFYDITLRALGAGLFVYNTDEYFVWVDSEGTLKAIDSTLTITTLTTGLDTTYRHEFWFYGLSGNNTLYGCNRTNGLYKITYSSGLVYSSVAAIPAWSMAFSGSSGRLFITDEHKSMYGLVQNQTAIDTTNLESFNASTQFLWVYPDLGNGVKRIVDNGEIIFYFKDTGIWALINAEESIANWFQPQCNADVGTVSPDTVQYVKYGNLNGYAYLGTDRTLRFFNAFVTRNAGTTPTLSGGDSIIISKSFQKLLDDIPDGLLTKCNGYFFGGYYILNIASSAATDIDTTIVIDMDKLENGQPYWFYASTMEYTHYIVSQSKFLYGFHKNGYISKLFVKDKYYDETPSRLTTTNDIRDYMIIGSITGTFVNRENVTGSASGSVGAVEVESSSILVIKNSETGWTVGETITGSKSSATATITSVVRRVAIDWSIYTAWAKYSSIEARLYDAYVNYRVEGKWNLDFSVNSFTLGEQIPDFDEATNFNMTPLTSGGAFFDVSFFDVSYFDSGNGQLSQNSGSRGDGHYFSFGFHNSNMNEWAFVYGIEPRFELIRNNSLGKNF